MAKPASTGPSWKPAKSSTTGNYGKAVSEAAKSKPKPALKGKPRAEGGPSR